MGVLRQQSARDGERNAGMKLAPPFGLRVPVKLRVCIAVNGDIPRAFFPCETKALLS